jgi:hypothetical protein
MQAAQDVSEVAGVGVSCDPTGPDLTDEDWELSRSADDGWDSGGGGIDHYPAELLAPAVGWSRRHDDHVHFLVSARHLGGFESAAPGDSVSYADVGRKSSEAGVVGSGADHFEPGFFRAG